MFYNKWFGIGYMTEHSCVRLNLVYNLVDISKSKLKENPLKPEPKSITGKEINEPFNKKIKTIINNELEKKPNLEPVKLFIIKDNIKKYLKIYNTSNTENEKIEAAKKLNEIALHLKEINELQEGIKERKRNKIASAKIRINRSPSEDERIDLVNKEWERKREKLKMLQDQEDYKHYKNIFIALILFLFLLLIILMTK